LIEAMIASVILAVAVIGIASLLLEREQHRCFVSQATDGRDCIKTIRGVDASSAPIADDHR
jgi:hypothetical protein